MEATKSLEKIERLIKITRNLTGRLAELNLRPKIDSKKTKTFVKAFIKKHVDAKGKPVSVSKSVGFKASEKDLTQCFGKYQDHYDFAKDLIRFVSIFHNFIIDLAVSTIILKYKINPRFIERLMDMVIGYSKLTIMLSTSGELTSCVFLYIAGYETVNKTKENDQIEVVKHFSELNDIIMRNQCHFINFGINFGKIFSECANIFKKWNNLSQYASLNVFSPEYFCQNFEMSLKNCKEVRLYNKINEWIIFGLLMSLKELANQEVYEMFKSAFANSTYQIIGYGIKVKTADIYAKMADYANALKISHFKSSLKEEIARPITLNRLIAKMTLIVDNINKMTNFLNEAPFNHARYFEITLTALETLGIEIKILAANIDAENMKDALNSLAAKKLFKAIHCLYVLAKSAKKYSKLIKEHFKRKIKTENVAKISELLQSLKEFNFYKENPEKLDCVDSLISLLSKGNISSNLKQIKICLEKSSTINSFVVNQEMQNEALKSGSFSTEIKQGHKTIRNVSALLLTSIHDVQEYLSYTKNVEKVVDRFSSIEDICFDSETKNTFIKLYKSNPYLFEDGFDFLGCFSHSIPIPREVMEYKTKTHLEMLIQIIDRTKQEFSLHIEDQLKFQKEKDKTELIKFDKILKSRANVAINAMKNFDKIEKVKINSLEIYPINILKDYLVLEFTNLMTSFSKCDGKIVSPFILKTKLIAITRGLLSIGLLGGLNVIDNAKYQIHCWFTSCQENDPFRLYIEELLSILQQTDTIYSQTMGEFATFPRNKYSCDILGDEALRALAEMIGIEGLKALEPVFENKLHALVSSLVIKAQDIEKMDAKNKKQKKFDSFVITAIDLTKILIFVKKLFYYVKRDIKNNLPILHESIEFVTKSESASLNEESKSFFQICNDPERVIRETTKTKEINDGLPQLVNCSDYILQSDLCREYSVGKGGISESNVFLAFEGILVVTKDIKTNLHEKIFKHTAGHLFQKYSNSDITTNKRSFEDINILRFIAEKSPFIGNNILDRLCPNNVFIE